jgi:TatD family hydrolase
MIFETHAHYDDAKFDTDREMLLAELPQRGISPVINVGSSIATTKTTLSLAQEYPFLYAAVGVHPSDVDDLNEDTYAWLRQQTTLQKTVAVGEIGLDYYWDKEPEIQAKQRYWFVRQLALAQQADLPVIIHSRDAAEDTMKIMEKAYEDGIKGVIHCYSYSPEMAQEYVKMASLIPSSPDRDAYGYRVCRSHSSPERSAHSSQIKINHFRKNPGAVSHAPGFHFISFFKFSESQNCFFHGFLPHIIHCLLP